MRQKASKGSPNHRLRDARQAHRWSQQEVADRVGTTSNTVSRWELGQTTPGPYFRARLCALFGASAQELGLIEYVSPPLNASEEAHEEPASTHVSSTTGDELVLWTVPSLRNPHFTGRDGLLERLTQHLSPAGTEKPTTTRRAALTQRQAIKGLGGLGKTQIAVEYAYRAREQGYYTHTIWINAASEETIMDSFLTLAERLPDIAATHETDQHKLVAAIIRWLEQCPNRWLLIFDNADELALIPQYIPRQGNGSILLTTRAHAVGSVAVALEVETMGLGEGTQFLLRRAQRHDASDEERNEAANIVIALDGFPLALDQAGAYIEETGCGFEEYLHLYQQHRRILLARRGKQATNYPDSVVTTWSLSFQKVEQASPAAAELLRLCAFLAPDHIPEELLKAGGAYWPALLQQAVTDLLAFHHMLEELLKFSLIKRRVEEHTLSLHRLVQVVQIDAMEPQEQRRWAERVVLATATVFPETVEATTWTRCQRYLPQVQMCATLIQEYAFAFKEAASLLARSARYLLDHALYEQAEPLFLRTIHIWEQTGEANRAELAASLNDLAVLYRKRGKYEQAEPLFLRTIHLWEQTGGANGAELAASLDNLAALYRMQGKYEQAEPLLLRAIQIWEQTRGFDHPEVASPLDNLAALYYEQGKYEQAKPLFFRALHIWERALGPTHPKVARSLNNLAALYVDEQKEYEQAESLFVRALDIWEQSLGPDHPETAYSVVSLAILYSTQEKYEQAEPLFIRALHIWEQSLGPNHSNLTYPLNGLARIHCKRGDYEQARELFQRALDIWEQTLGPTQQHPYKAEILYDFAIMWEAQNNLQEAISLYRRALAIREQVLGAHHPETTKTRERLCTALQAMSKAE